MGRSFEHFQLSLENSGLCNPSSSNDARKPQSVSGPTKSVAEDLLAGASPRGCPWSPRSHSDFKRRGTHEAHPSLRHRLPACFDQDSSRGRSGSFPKSNLSARSSKESRLVTDWDNKRFRLTRRLSPRLPPGDGGGEEDSQGALIGRS